MDGTNFYSVFIENKLQRELEAYERKLMQFDNMAKEEQLKGSKEEIQRGT